MDEEVDCKCIKIIGHLESVKWPLYPRHYKASAGPMSLGDWTDNPFIWLHYVESCDGSLADDDVLKTKDTRYWEIEDVQRYFVSEMHCEQVLFTSQYPNLRLPTAHGGTLWRANTSLKRKPKLYQKELNMSLEITLKKMEAQHSQMDRLIISDQLLSLDRLDCFKRQTFFRILLNILSFQERLQLVSLENLCCKRLEGTRLIQQLACFNSHSLKYLFLWRFVLPNENPLLINYSYITGTGQYIPRPPTRRCFIRSLAAMRNLRVLALEHSHLADDTGGALVSLLPVLKRPHFRLHLICRTEQTPGRANPELGAAGRYIPDTAWKRVAIACPDLYVLMVFFRMREHDDIVRFLPPSMPLRETHLQRGVELLPRVQRQHCDLGCFVRHIAHCYANTLVSLSIHDWRGVHFPLRRVLELMPRLARFRYAGVATSRDLRAFLNIIAYGVCDHLKEVKIEIQDEEANRQIWMDEVKKLSDKYDDIMTLYNISFCIKIYKC